MGHDELLRALEEVGRAERDALLNRAMEGVRRILIRTEEKANKFKIGYLKECAASIEDVRARELNKARAKAKGVILRAEQKIISDVFDKAERRFPTLKDYPAVIKSLFMEVTKTARKEVGDEKYHVFLSMKDLDILKDLVKPGRYSDVVLIPLDDVSCGVVLSTSDGKVRFINTLSGRLKKAKIRLMPLIKNRLFKEG